MLVKLLPKLHVFEVVWIVVNKIHQFITIFQGTLQKLDSVNHYFALALVILLVFPKINLDCLLDS